MTEAELVARLARDLGPLATDAQWSTVAAGALIYGDYTDAIMDAFSELAIVTPLAEVTDNAATARSA